MHSISADLAGNPSIMAPVDKLTKGESAEPDDDAFAFVTRTVAFWLLIKMRIVKQTIQVELTSSEFGSELL